MRELFEAHPRSVGESYTEHLRFAAGFGFTMLKGGVAAILHGLLPFLFVTTGSETMEELLRRMEESHARAKKAKQAQKPKRPRRAKKAAAQRRSTQRTS
jgi:hypothetical protein